jgi:histidinol-phosphate aminotransferase
MTTEDLDTRLAHVLRADVREQAAYHVGDATGLVKLDAMENPFTMPPSLLPELGRRLLAVEVNRYPASRAGALVETLRQVMQIPDHAGILLGNGSDELIGIIATAVSRPGAKILSPVPSFVMYEVLARYAHVQFVGVPLNADFSLDAPAMVRAIELHQPSVVYIAYPNNPTGSMFSREAVQAVIDHAPGLVVIDEAYQAFAPDSFMSSLSQHPHVVIMRTVSKSGLAGLRLGYLVGAQQWIGELDKVRPPYNINVLTQSYAQFALEHKDVLDGQAAILRHERSRLIAALRERRQLTVFDSAANFVLFRVESVDALAAGRVFDGLIAHGVLIRNLSHSHPLLANCLRVTVSTSGENAAFLAALDASLLAALA